jgi:hypothetical protein
MPKDATSGLPQPIFNEGNVTPDPTRFKTAHPSDTRQDKEIEKLLKTKLWDSIRRVLRRTNSFNWNQRLGRTVPRLSKELRPRERLSSMPLATLVLRTKESTGTRLLSPIR